MSRKKTAKRAVKRQTTSKAAPSKQKMEKDFQAAAATAAAQMNNEITRTKQQVAKFKATQNKAKADVQKAEARIKNAQKTKQTKTGKKQLKTATKQRTNATKVLAAIAKQLNDAEKALENATNAQARLIALSKHVAQFEQIWVKTSKKVNKPKAAKKIKRKSKAKNLAVKEIDVIQNIQPLHIAENDGSLDTATELAS